MPRIGGGGAGLSRRPLDSTARQLGTAIDFPSLLKDHSQLEMAIMVRVGCAVGCPAAGAIGSGLEELELEPSASPNDTNGFQRN